MTEHKKHDVLFWATVVLVALIFIVILHEPLALIVRPIFPC
jgi:hypothetical protein